MFLFLFESVVSLLVSLVSAIGGCITSDTVVGTAFVPPSSATSSSSSVAQQQQQQRRGPAAATAAKTTAANRNGRTNSVRASSLSLAREAEDLLQQRRIQACKYFGAATLVALGAAVAAWDRWPLLWLLRTECVIIAVCAMIKGPGALARDDFIRIPLTMVPWYAAVDYLLLAQ